MDAEGSTMGYRRRSQKWMLRGDQKWMLEPEVDARQEQGLDDRPNGED